MTSKRFCFIIMPFKPELNYFYLYIKKHIEENHNTECFRGDNNVLTIPLLEKIKDYIEKSDILIADCTGRNANVFYELGIAHTLNKKVILISMDDIKDAPTDIRHFEFIKYSLDKHEDFLSKLDNALSNVFVANYEHLYEKALIIFDQFQKDNNIDAYPIKKEIFTAKVMTKERLRPIPELTEEVKIKQFLLPLIIDTSSDFDVMEKVTRWLTEN
ncbi:MAG: hypothetical protein JWQ09_5178 [Segetibacter sp.]|nr:hypothetical protein [Segetibacter sp.]